MKHLELLDLANNLRDELLKAAGTGLKVTILIETETSSIISHSKLTIAELLGIMSLWTARLQAFEAKDYLRRILATESSDTGGTQ